MLSNCPRDFLVDGAVWDGNPIPNYREHKTAATLGHAATAALPGLAGAQPGKSVGAPFLAANAMMDSEKAIGIVFLLHGGQSEIV